MTPNIHLMKEKGFSDERIGLLLDAYSKMGSALQRPELYTSNGKQAAEFIRTLEGHIQILWGFDYDPTYWYMEFMLEPCTCPVQDNMEMQGKTHARIYNRRCPIHGEYNTEDF